MYKYYNPMDKNSLISKRKCNVCKKWLLNHSAPLTGHLDTSLGAL